MSRLLGVLGWIGAALALAALIVHGLEDRRTLVPPPDAVAAEFVRQIVTGRAEQAMPLLSDRLRPRWPPDDLDAAGRRLESELGEVGDVSAELESIFGERAAASAILDGARGTRSLRFEFVREQGKWLIEEAGGLAPATFPAPAS